MNHLKQIRIQFGLTQEEIAQYLEIKRSLWSLCEIGKRDLPTQALVKLAEMELFLVNFASHSNKKSLPYEAEQLLKVQAVLALHQKELAYQQLVLQRKLSLLQKNYQNNIQLLEFLKHLEEKNNTVRALELKWRTIMKTTAIQNIEANGLHHQAKIKLKMQMNILQDDKYFINNFHKFIKYS